MTKLEYLRREAGLSPEQLAKRIALQSEDQIFGGTTIRRLESGVTQRPFPSTLKALADFFEVSQFTLLDEVTPEELAA